MLDPSSGGGGFAGGGGSGAARLCTGTGCDAAARDRARPMAMLTKAPPKPQTFDQRWTAWGSASAAAAISTAIRLSDRPMSTPATYGFAGGMDYHLSPDTLFGFAFAGGGTNWSLAQNLGTGRSDAFEAGVYAKTHSGPAYLSAALAFANHWFTTNRTSALGDQLHGKFPGPECRRQAGSRLSLRIAVEPVSSASRLMPRCRRRASIRRAYTETDLTAGGFGLTFAAMNATDARSELGCALRRSHHARRDAADPARRVCLGA